MEIGQRNSSSTGEPGPKVRGKIKSTEANPEVESGPDPNFNAAFRSRSLNKPPRNAMNKPGSKPISGVTNRPGVTGSSLFGGKNIGQKCSSNQECFSTNCQFGKTKPGQRPKPPPKAKPVKTGRRKRAVLGQDSSKPIHKPKPNLNQSPNPTPKPGVQTNGTKTNQTLPMGTCRPELEKDPVPKGNIIRIEIHKYLS